MVAWLISVLALATVAIVVLVVLLVLSAAGRRTVGRGFDRPPAQQHVIPKVRQPASVRPVPPAEAPPVPVPPPRRAEPASVPPSLVEATTPAPASLAGDVELGFEGDTGRVGVRGGSAMQRAFAFYAEELLADLRRAREV